MEGTSIQLYVGGVLQLSATDSSQSAGAIGLITQGGAMAKYDDIVVNDFSAVNADSMFTGFGISVISSPGI